MKKLFNLLVLGFLITLLGIAPSSAHTSLVASTPKIDSKLPTAPQAISLQFDEDLLVNYVNVRKLKIFFAIFSKKTEKIEKIR